MKMHVRNDLRSSRAVVLHDIPVFDARGFAEGAGEEGEVGAELLGCGFCVRGVGEVGEGLVVGSGSEEDMSRTDR